MIKYCLEKWNKNKDVLEKAIREHDTGYDNDYTNSINAMSIGLR